MPEGHTIHRAARLQTRRFVGDDLAVSSPQGRFAAGAARLDGNRIERIEAAGKHLFYRWSHGPILHIHLGLVGKFRTFTGAAPPPTDGTRLAWTNGAATLYLAGPMICDLVEPDRVEAVRAGLGPDPLARRTGDLERFTAALGRRTVAVGAALLDQAVVAGIGNVYRSELLFLTGVDPHRPSRDLGGDEAKSLWDEAVRQLRIGERGGRIVTVDPAEVGARTRRDLGRDQRLYVYKRHDEACRRCGTRIMATELGARTVWWCPSCQPR